MWFGILREVSTEKDEVNWCVEFQTHVDCPSNFKKFLNVNRSQILMIRRQV
jgi:hypothetical protein